MSTSLVLLDVLVRGENWFHGKISRETTIDLLTTAGAFLVRENPKSDGELALSVRTDWGQVMHFNVRQDIPGKFRFDGAAFASVHELIEYYKSNNFSVSKEFPAKLVAGVPPKQLNPTSMIKRGIVEDADMFATSLTTSKYQVADGVAGLASDSVLERCNAHARRELSAVRAVLDVLPPADPAGPALRQTIAALTSASEQVAQATGAVGTGTSGGGTEALPVPAPITRGRSRVLAVETHRPVPPPPRTEAGVRTLRSPDLLRIVRSTSPADSAAGTPSPLTPACPLPTRSILSDDSLGSFMDSLGRDLDQSRSTPDANDGTPSEFAMPNLSRIIPSQTASPHVVGAPRAVVQHPLALSVSVASSASPLGREVQLTVKMSRSSASERWGFAISEGEDDCFVVIDLAT
jgi:hypothetical protein